MHTAPRKWLTFTAAALASVLAFASSAGAIVIDPFDDGEQVAVGIGNTVDTALGIGGKRFMQATVEATGGVSPNDDPGIQFAFTNGDLGGR